MPFYGFQGIPDPNERDKTVAGTVRSWFVSKGAVTHPEQKLGTVEVGGKTYEFVICFPAFIDRLCVEEGATVQADDFIVKWIADGESITYGRTYFRLECGDA